MRMPPLETDRLLIRPFALEDVDAAYQLLDVDLADVSTGTEGVISREQRRAWIAWSALNHEQLAYLRQPPYGDRAVTLRATGELVGAAGLVPSLAPFDQLPSLGVGTPTGLFTAEVGLYWAIAPQHQRQGYATEVAHALIDFALRELRLKRIIAMTTYDNAASMAVMRKAGMHLERNPQSEPFWLQVVGIRENEGVA